MELNDILYELSRGKNIVISYLTNAMIKLSFLVALNIIRENREVAVVDESNYIARYIPLELVENIHAVDSIEEACGDEKSFLIVFMPKNMRKLIYCRAQDILVFANPIKLHGFKEYVKYYLERINEEDEYVLSSPSRGSIYRFRIRENKLELVEKPPGILGQAYDVIKNTASTYGDLTIKDALIVLVKETGLDKKHARNILVNLAKRGYIRVHKGKITLA